MTDIDLLAVWPHIRALVERAAKTHNDDYGHDLCPWSFDAVELPAALDYVEAVLAAETPAPPEAP